MLRDLTWYCIGSTAWHTSTQIHTHTHAHAGAAVELVSASTSCNRGPDVASHTDACQRQMFFLLFFPKRYHWPEVRSALTFSSWGFSVFQLTGKMSSEESDALRNASKDVFFFFSFLLLLFGGEADWWRLVPTLVFQCENIVPKCHFSFSRFLTSCCAFAESALKCFLALCFKDV